jgi:molybdopterin molybdotransferase
MQEQCAAVDGERVRIDAVPQAGQWIRRRGEDVRSGAVVLLRGARLTPQALGLAASVGAATLEVAPRVRVALLSTGDELVMPGEPLKPGAIYNSNRYTLKTLIESLGCHCTDLGIVPDRLEATRAAFVEASARCDLILTSGGVSVGEEDHVRPAVQTEGALDLWQVAMKPGKPLAFGHVRTVPFIGLPGNPVSSFVTFLLFARPFILCRQGAQWREPVPLPLTAQLAVDAPVVLPERVTVKVNALLPLLPSV